MSQSIYACLGYIYIYIYIYMAIWKKYIMINNILLWNINKFLLFCKIHTLDHINISSNGTLCPSFNKLNSSRTRKYEFILHNFCAIKFSVIYCRHLFCTAFRWNIFPSVLTPWVVFYRGIRFRMDIYLIFLHMTIYWFDISNGYRIFGIFILKE